MKEIRKKFVIAEPKIRLVVKLAVQDGAKREEMLEDIFSELTPDFVTAAGIAMYREHEVLYAMRKRAWELRYSLVRLVPPMYAGRLSTAIDKVTVYLSHWHRRCVDQPDIRDDVELANVVDPSYGPELEEIKQNGLMPDDDILC